MNRLGFTSNVLSNQFAHASYGASAIGSSIPLLGVTSNITPVPPPPTGNYLVTNAGAYFVDQSANKLIFV